jgi:hypothetical protein
VDFAAKKLRAATENGTQKNTSANIWYLYRKEKIMKSLVAKSTQKSSKIQTASSAQRSEQDAACRSLTPTETITFVPLSLETQICLVSLTQAYLSEFCSPDVHFMAMMHAVEIAQKFGVSKEEAIEVMDTIRKHYKNPFPGFF